MKRTAIFSMSAVLCAALGAAAAPFRVYQFALPGASGAVGACQPDGVQSVPFAEYAHNRWVAPSGLKLIGTDCAAGAGDLLQARSGLAIAAVRFADEPPRQALLDLSSKTPPSVPGWPAPPLRRQGANAPRSAPRAAPATLRLAAVCWPAIEAWPVPANREGKDALPSLEPKNPCEWWLLPIKPSAAGDPQPDLAGRSFLVVPNSRDEWAGRFRARQDWPELFSADPNVSIQDALENGWDKAPAATEEQLAANEGSMAAASRAARPVATQQARAAPSGGALAACPSDVSTAQPAVFERFSAWAERFGVSPGTEGAWLPSRWTGRCATYEVLRSALEERLGCRLDADVCARQDEAGR